jgi:rhomboid protease GluP
MSAFDDSIMAIDPVETDLVEAGHYPTEADARAHGLVVLSLGHPYWLVEAANGFRVLIEPAIAGSARAHLAAYDREALRWPPAPTADPWIPKSFDPITPLLWALSVLLVFEVSLRTPALLDRFATNPPAIVERGEWWRVITALFLHGDAPHLLSNLLGGLLAFTAVTSTFGRVRGWISVFAAAAIANATIALLSYPSATVSLGASTAIFAAVGLLCGRAVRSASRSSYPHRWRAIFVPFATGLIVLAMYGAGGQRVDLGAHLAGFASGVIGGFVVTSTSRSAIA